VFAWVFSANVYLFRIPAGYFDPVASLDPFLHLWTLAAGGGAITYVAEAKEHL
jgi:peptidoglycan/LPS O-acetylase OafA/YrhL